MKALPKNSELEALSRRVIWFESPEDALADPVRFVAYALTYGTYEDIKIIRTYLSDDDLREALDQAPAGIIDGRSWAYWNLMLGRYPAPPMPTRTFGDENRYLTLFLETRNRSLD